MWFQNERNPTKIYNTSWVGEVLFCQPSWMAILTDPREGTKDAIFFIFMQFFGGKLATVIDWQPHVCSWHPLLDSSQPSY